MAVNKPFGEFLRTRRARLPADDGSGSGRARRRTPGLKREEVALRAGISTEWYVKLEQGCVVAPSDDTLEALGRALALGSVDLRHLHALAAAGKRQPFRRENVPDTLRGIVANLPEPAYVTGQRWDVLAWNDAATGLFGDFGGQTDDWRNILRWMLTDAAARTLFGDGWADEARRMVALFRATHDLWQDDPAFATLVDHLRTACADFGPWWDTHAIGAPVAGSKLLRHPTRGLLRFDYATFQANDDPALKLALYIERRP